MDLYARNELPETVKRYKAYTAQFQEWLILTAVQRNVERASQIWERAKQPKGKKTPNISIEQQARLVDDIAKTRGPLADTSGLRDLSDAIRSRKEITQYYAAIKSSDTGHTHFNGALERCRAILKGMLPSLYETQDVEDESSNFIVTALYNAGDDDDEVDAEGAEKTAEPEDRPDIDNSKKGSSRIPKTRSNNDPLTAEEYELQREYRVLVFLYELKRIRGIVCDMWTLYNKGEINTITAALVADLAQSHVQQNVVALVEELSLRPGGLAELVLKLYWKMLGDTSSEPGEGTTPQFSKDTLRHLFCIDGISSLNFYLRTADTKVEEDQLKTSQRPYQAVLRFFEAIRNRKVKLPIWDKFTEDMLLHGRESKDWLYFGWQIVVDVQKIVCVHSPILLSDITEQSLDTFKMMRDHVDYEDAMWKSGEKPDYLSSEEFKFSDVFLNPLESLLGWIQQLTSDEVPAADQKLPMHEFVRVHTTLAGLSMWHFNKVYQGTSIRKVQWFVTCLAHLYNAARQVGDLNIDWPDLHFIVQMHGTQRLFLGDPPTDSKDFLHRFWLATCTSSRFMASDHRNKGRYAPRTARETHHKRALMPHFPLEETIRSYYGPNPRDDRWMKRHAVFNYLHQRKEPPAAHVDGAEPPEDDAKVEELRDTFTRMAAKISPSSSSTSSPKKDRKGAPPRVPVPDFSAIDDTYADLFSRMKTELKSHQLHTNFDYLSFYRRAYTLIMYIRENVLLDGTMQIARSGEINQNPNPSNITLLTGLFRGLKANPKDRKKVGDDGDDGNTVAWEQLRRIGEVMEGLIEEEGGVELERAKLRTRCDWEGLKASYAKEEEE
ncbi:hypothetical protein N0V83_005066 [Neocucurbitaria cava]|uniref:DUF6604 domain-containing protein n=1 Tax=Neocucurbitaria cava TaxID=798079 RepID=A0A9W9CMT7_9PLEO|nr:hypothetical protein N0V83_005066 [Neocucurbitaria cava]